MVTGGCAIFVGLLPVHLRGPMMGEGVPITVALSVVHDPHVTQACAIVSRDFPSLGLEAEIVAEPASAPGLALDERSRGSLLREAGGGRAVARSDGRAPLAQCSSLRCSMFQTGSTWPSHSLLLDAPPPSPCRS